MAIDAQTTYEQVLADHRWDVPDRYNIAADVCDKHPREKLAMVHEHFSGAVREVSWGELQDLANQAANVLAALGVQRGDRVAVVLPPTPETAAVFFGVVEDRRDPAVDVGAVRRRGDPPPADGLAERRCSSPTPRTRRGSTRAWSSRSLVLDERHARRRRATEFTTADTAADDPAQLYYTSGTTGLAKGIVHAHRYLLAHEEFIYCHDVQRRRALPRDGRVGVGGGDRAAARPVAASARCSACYQREGGFEPDRQLDFLSRHAVTNVFTTPTAIRSMMAIADAGTRYPQQFRIVCSAGEPLNPEAIRWFREQYGVTVLDFYGLTESYPLCANFPFMEVREGSMGRPMPGWDVAILDEDEQPVAQGERGEICLRARTNPHYPLGYWNLPEASEETFGGEWFHTKDAARMDEDGYFWYEGRADDVIIAAGYRDRARSRSSRSAWSIRRCAEAAAVASPDERRGNVVKAFIVLAGGYEPSDELAEEIKAFVRDAPVRLRLSAPDRVRHRAAQDADRQDPPHRAAPAGARPGGAVTPCPVSRRTPARDSRAACARR